MEWDDATVTDAKGKVDALNHLFESVFTQEEPISADLLPDQSRFPAMEEIEITVPGVQKYLRGFKSIKPVDRTP